jgi:phosphate starvation-inducible protein PhoH
MDSVRLTKRQRRLMAKQGVIDETPTVNFKNHFRLNRIEPLTQNQLKTFVAYEKEKNLVLHGMAGTGKTFISLYLALSDIVSGETPYHKVVIVRSVVPTRDMGFLPGNAKEKAAVYEAPYQAICSELFGRDDAYKILKDKNAVEFISTSFIRGITLQNCIVIVDEVNNMTFHEIDSVITRIGKNCRIMFCGDFRQSDLTREQEKNGLKNFMRITKQMDSFDNVEFTEDDIVRSGLVRDYIITRERLNISA